jgi:diguanylate cyclase (GGDEF)-like protein/PAS domain S-box-containing protein
MASTRQDIVRSQARSGDQTVSIPSGAAQALSTSERAARWIPGRDERARLRPRRMTSFQVRLLVAFAFAAVIPSLVALGLDSIGPDHRLPGSPLTTRSLMLVILLVSAGFGTVLGVIASHRLIGSLDALARVVDAVGVDGDPPPLPITDMCEVARLSGALAALRTRVISRDNSLDALDGIRDDAVRRARDEHYEMAARGSNDGLWDWDLSADTLYCSPRWHAIAGIDDGGDVVAPSFWMDRVHQDDLPRMRAAIDAHLRGHVDHLICESRVRGDDGNYRWTLCRGLALRREDGTPYRMAGSLTDIAERRDAEEQRLHDAHHDPLTGLANRTLFLERLTMGIRRAKRTDAHRVAVVLMDVDRFKVVNDSLGHALGDEVLIAIARRLESCVRDVDTVARLGGDEWAILVDDLATVDDARGVAERVRDVLHEPLSVGGHSLFVTVSTGIALLMGETKDPDDLLRDAETAMYRAKELGRDRHVVFDASLHGRAVALLALESDLRFALERGELLVHYQPIVRADDLSVRGVEALVRWRHPERGLVPPAEFIGFAEDSGLILPLGEWVLGRAIEQMREWQAAGVAPERISVNLSARQLHQENLAEHVALMLERAGLDPACLELELTEGVVAEQADATIEVLRQLRGLGIQLAVDDFGTGYSSLVYLTRFPVSTVKIDRAFLVDIQHDAVNQAIVQAVTTLAHSIGMRVVAEGIETTGQLVLARSLGCDEIQGYLISKPLSTDLATVWLGGQRGMAVVRRAALVREVP